MAKENLTENIFDIEQILMGFTRSLTKASEDLHQTFQNRPDLSYEYTIPQMKITVNLALSYSKGRVKGWFVSKTKSTNTKEISSTIELDVRAIPRRGS